MHVAIAMVNAGLCLFLFFGALFRQTHTASRLSFMAGIFLLALESALGAFSLWAVSLEEFLFWQKFKMLCVALLPCAWLTFSLTYARGNYRDFLQRWKPGLVLTFALPLALVAGFFNHLFLEAKFAPEEGRWVLLLSWPARGIYLCFLMGLVLSLMNLERTLSAAIGTQRWRIKYLVLGLFLLLGVRVYTSSQVLLYKSLEHSMVLVASLALLLGALMISFSVIRSRLAEVDLYPSPAVLRGSVTVFLVGLYLLVVGVFAQVVSLLGGVASFQLKAFLILLGLAGLGVLSLSDRLRQRIQLFVARHFHRPSYDYREVWANFTQRTATLMDQAVFCRAAVKLISETFNLLSVSIWLVDEQQQQIGLAASTLLASESTAADPLSAQGSSSRDPDPAPGARLSEPQARAVGADNTRSLAAQVQTAPASPAKDAELIEALRKRAAPFDIDQCQEPWVDRLRQINPDYFKKGGNRVCVPLIHGGELLGLITAADRVSGLRFTPEDYDLLKRLGDQVAASLRSFRLSEQILQARELEAFQAMSAFFVHDLKNTASTLSLMLKNMEAHFHNPEFRQDAMRGLSKSVEHINDIIQRLGMLRQKLEIKSVACDLGEVVTQSIHAVGAAVQEVLDRDLPPVPRLMLDPEQMQKVITNLLLNAREALGRDGRIRVQTGVRERWAVLTVADNGCGMPPEFLRHSLFKPFQTTKKRGLGIGMFQSKMIVEAHRGRIEVESEPGKGTTFRILLPLHPAGDTDPIVKQAS